MTYGRFYESGNQGRRNLNNVSNSNHPTAARPRIASIRLQAGYVRPHAELQAVPAMLSGHLVLAHRPGCTALAGADGL